MGETVDDASVNKTGTKSWGRKVLAPHVEDNPKRKKQTIANEIPKARGEWIVSPATRRRAGQGMKPFILTPRAEQDLGDIWEQQRRGRH